MIGAIIARKKSIQSAGVVERFPDKPWMLREDWAQGKIKSSIVAQALTSLIVGLALCGLGGLGSFAIVPQELEAKNYLALFILIFPLVGIGLLFAFVSGLRSRMRYGQCYLELAQVPIPPGGTLEGMIETGARFTLKHGLHLRLSCIHRVVTQFRNSSSVSEHVLWHDEKDYKSGAELPEPEPGHTGVPVHFKLPDGQPPCFARGNESVFWRLEATAKMDGPNFSATFDVPVFEVGGAAGGEADEPDPTAGLQVPAGGEVRRDEHSKIKVTDGPGGREFYFPAARNAGPALIVTVTLIVWSGIFWIAWQHRAPLFFLIFWGFISVLIGLGCFNGWFKSTRVTVNSTGVRRVNRYLFFNVPKQFAAGDVGRFESSAAAKGGPQKFSEIRLVRQTGDGMGIIIATGIANPEDANWLAQEMNRALGRGA
jgi:hypothetical protein